MQAILGVGSSVVGLWFYFNEYVRPVRKSPLRSWDKTQVRPLHKKAAAEIRRRFSDRSNGSDKAARTPVQSRGQVDSVQSARTSPRYRHTESGSSTSTDSYEKTRNRLHPDQSSGFDSTDTDNSDAAPHRPSSGLPPACSYPPLPTPPPDAPRPPPGAAPARRGIPVQINNGAQTLYQGMWDVDSARYIP